MEQSIEGNTRKPGSGVACKPRGRFWGHDVKGSMRELLLDAHISISCMEERTVWTALRSGLQGCSAQIGLQGSFSGISGCTKQIRVTGSCCTKQVRAGNGLAAFRVFSVESLEACLESLCVRQSTRGRITHTERVRCNAVHGKPFTNASLGLGLRGLPGRV